MVNKFKARVARYEVEAGFGGNFMRFSMECVVTKENQNQFELIKKAFVNNSFLEVTIKDDQK